MEPVSGRQSPLILAAVDHCLLGAKEMDSLLETVAARCELSKECLLITFSHTHSAALMGLDRVGLPGGDLIPGYLEQLAESLAAIVSRARNGIQPAVITYGTGRCSLGANRDMWDAASGQFVCGFNPDGISDDTVLVARVSDLKNGYVASIVNYACHPTTLAWQNALISPDFPGAMREVIEQATGAPCVFLQGASGDIGPRYGYVGDVSAADRNGRILGYSALAALESLVPPATRYQYTGPVISGATLGTWSHVPLDDKSRAAHARWEMRRLVVELPYRTDLPTLAFAQAEQQRWQLEEQAAHASHDLAHARDARAMAERMTRIINRLANLPPGDSFPLPVALLRIGDACWLALECEHYNMLQRSLRERFGNYPIMVATLTNGARATYLPTRESYGKGIYQESIALVAPGSLEKVVDAASKHIAAMFHVH
jgi:hypothetical protein